MQKSNKTINALLELINRGYKITKEGLLFNPKGIEIKGNVDNTGYRNLGYRYMKSDPTHIHFHRIQGYTKFGNAIFEEGIMIRHLDGNPLNNMYDNIEIGTNRENQLDIPVEKRILRSTHSIYNHKDIINDHKAGLSYKDIMKKYNIKSKGTISYIINNSVITNKEFLH